MPVCLIEAPTGIRRDAKKRLVERTTAALNEAYPAPTSASSFANTRSRTLARTVVSNRNT
jgi:hypothetical protein